jgi:hypothetical protein
VFSVIYTLVREGIIHWPVISASALTWFIRNIYAWNLQFLNNFCNWLKLSTISLRICKRYRLSMLKPFSIRALRSISVHTTRSEIIFIRYARNQEDFNLKVILSKYGEALQVERYLSKPVIIILDCFFIKGCQEMSVFEI